MTNDKIKSAVAAVAVCVVLFGAACLGGLVAYLAAVAVMAIAGHLYNMIGGVE